MRLHSYRDLPWLTVIDVVEQGSDTANMSQSRTNLKIYKDVNRNNDCLVFILLEV